MQTLNLDNIETIIGQWGEFKTNALEILDRMLESYPNNIILLQNRGSVLNDRGEFREAISNSDKLLEIDSQNITALNSLGYALRKLGRNEDAIIILDGLLKIDPHNLNALNNKGVALSNMNKNREAIRLYDEILKIDPSFEYALNNKARAQKKLNEENILMNKQISLDDIKLSKEQEELFEKMENCAEHFFITGKAGTGKSVLLQYFKSRSKKRLIVGAFTGVAALNIGAQTLNSLFNLPFGLIDVSKLNVGEQTKTLLRNIDTIVIDEISMVRADMLDAIDFLLKQSRGNNIPFGGVQMILFGDLYQLQPIVEDKALQQFFAHNHGGFYFFNAHVWKNTKLNTFELVEVFRQKDQSFVSILDRVRKGEIDDAILSVFNERVVDTTPEDGIITLTSTNSIADNINYGRLNQIKEKTYEYASQVTGKFDSSAFPADGILSLKKGAQIMCLVNDPSKRWVNGTIGTVDSLSEDLIQVNINGVVFPISQHTWNKKRYRYNRNTRKVEEEIIATFTQFPLRLAWAITIHKSQGKTYDSVFIDLGNGAFTHGQTYVALSRCSTFNGLCLRRSLTQKDIIIDIAVVEFMKKNFINNKHLKEIYNDRFDPEKKNPKPQENELMGLIERQGQELGEFRKFFSDIAPLLDKLDRSPEIVQAIMNGKITTDIVKALTKDSLNPKEVPEEINPNDIPF